ncbi:phosphate ABC transporter substrate-binding protein PstS [Parabacteroides sp. Marseille-P3160]|uniref:phosphate ABC transporter substrate-binding protein PstS n=1 Tax=Parabacteroides sp. Marseille-P3160 TaxID=1917887 RepID=UPI0009B9BA3E|nr:phosphate ABC transporter substrate-binding protein PstS [Parabacteroides sp. Marseille-P3160]
MKKVLLYAASLLMLVACNSSKKDSIANLSGAGATFPAPFYNIVFKKYTETMGGKVTYGAVGSGGGIRSLKDKTVDFGATDVFLSDDELKEIGGEIVHIPTAMGAVVLSYNLKNVADLKLTPETISEIYRGKITNWNDPKIKVLNPDITLPNQAITPVYRSDGSGTTFVFSDYMSKADSLWEGTIGRGKSLNFATGISAKGNPGVAGIVAETVGSIGYIGSEYALALNIPSAAIRNASGNFVKANEKSISAAAEVEIPADTRIMITNSSNPEAYPISTFTWLIAYKEQGYNKRSEDIAKSLVSLFNYMISAEGQALAGQSHYAPLSAAATNRTQAIIKSMTYNGNPIVTGE